MEFGLHGYCNLTQFPFIHSQLPQFPTLIMRLQPHSALTVTQHASFPKLGAFNSDTAVTSHEAQANKVIEFLRPLTNSCQKLTKLCNTFPTYILGSNHEACLKHGGNRASDCLHKS